MRKKIIIIIIICILVLSGCLDNRAENKNNIISGIEMLEYLRADAGENYSIKAFALKNDGSKEDISQKIIWRSDNKKIKGENNTFIIPEDALTGEIINIIVEYDKFSKNIEIEVLNSLKKNIDLQGIITNFDRYDAVVNKERNLPDDYIPKDLTKLEVETCLPNPEINQMRKDASDALTEMFLSAENDNIKLVARSGYRSYLTQESLYNGIINKYGQGYADKYSAKPGQSEHQTGLAIDITSQSVQLQLDDNFSETEEGIWVNNNAHNFGFIIRYPQNKEEITGYLYEPWHLRYLGKNLAVKIYKSGLTVEEFFASE